MTFPFPYLNHGPLDPESFDKADQIWLAFRAPVPEDAQRAIMQSCPAAVAGFFRWDQVLFHSESCGDIYNAVVAEEFGGNLASLEVSEEAARRFSEAMERWVLGIHAEHPVAFFIGPSRPLPGDAWDEWSSTRVGDEIAPWLEAYLDARPGLPDEVDEADEGEEEEPPEGAEPIGKNPFTGEPIYEMPPKAMPMDRTTLSYVAQYLEVDDLPRAERERVRALTARLGWSSSDD